MLIAEIIWSEELLRAMVGLVFVAVLGGAAGYFFERAKHRSDVALEALNRFYDLYGRWFATWKEWEVNPTKANPKRDDLLGRAAQAEGEFESLLVRIATEQRLNEGQTKRLARYREGYQRLREVIEAGDKLSFDVQKGGAEPYLTFKSLSVEFASLLEGRRGDEVLRWVRRRPPLRSAQETLVRVTSWRMTVAVKDQWWKDPGNASVERSVEKWRSLPYAWPPEGRLHARLRTGKDRLKAVIRPPSEGRR